MSIDGRILLVAGDRPLRALLRVALKHKGCMPVFAPTAEQAIQRLTEYPYDLIIIDLALPDLPGISLVQQIRQTTQYQDTPVIILADHIDRTCVREAAKLKVLAVLLKPISVNKLNEHLQKALEQKEVAVDAPPPEASAYAPRQID